MRKVFLLFTLLLTTIQAIADDPIWSYQGKTGPEEWGNLSKEFETCKYGKQQSPIEISNDLQRHENKLQFDYKPSSLNIVNLTNNAQINYDRGSTLTIDGNKYELVQFHFHIPSEHTIHGKRYDMEIHLVHKNAQDKLAVIGIFVEKGKENAFLQHILEHIPDTAQIEKKLETTFINIDDIVPDNKHFEYDGSLTTPPCTEGVHWNIIETPITASLEQIDIIKEKFGQTARKIQRTARINK